LLEYVVLLLNYPSKRPRNLTFWTTLEILEMKSTQFYQHFIEYL
jgi:hypothetical protein